ncbi:MAG TPA: hypothetical protein VIG30_17895 [Ktedonobacterales bacterium]
MSREPERPDGRSGPPGHAHRSRTERDGERTHHRSPRDDRSYHGRDDRDRGGDDRRYRDEPYPDEGRRHSRDRERGEPPSASRHRRHDEGGERYDDGRRSADRGGYGERYEREAGYGGGHDQRRGRFDQYDQYDQYDQFEQDEQYAPYEYERAARPTRPRDERDPRDARDVRRVAPSRASYGYEQPADLWGAYGQPGARTRPVGGDPATMPLAPRGAATRTRGGQRAGRRTSRRGLWITLGVLAALLVVLGGGGAYAYGQYLAPGKAAEAFCGALKANDATTAYGQLAAAEQAQLTEGQLSLGLKTLTTIEGGVVACAVSASGAGYGYQLGGATATVSATITRATAGALRGTLTLANEGGAWKIARLDTSLLGADPGALAAAATFCAALQSQDYTSAFGLLASAGGQTQQVFTQAAQTHDQIDGLVTACGPVSLGQFQSAAGSSLTLSVTRAKLAARKGTVTLADATNSWRITTLDSTILGTDLGPLQVGTRFCADLASGNYADAYSLLSAREQAMGSADQFAAQIAPPSPLTWAGCTPNLSTYRVTGTSASYSIALTLRDTANGVTASAAFVVTLVLENGAWRMDNLQKA